jgi:hypothetical protein
LRSVTVDCDRIGPAYLPRKLIAEITDVQGHPNWQYRPDSFLWPDETFIDVGFDKIGVRSVRIYNRPDIDFEMHRDFSIWRFITSRHFITTQEESKYIQLMDPRDNDKVSADSSVFSSVGVCVQVN